MSDTEMESTTREEQNEPVDQEQTEEVTVKEEVAQVEEQAPAGDDEEQDEVEDAELVDETQTENRGDPADIDDLNLDYDPLLDASRFKPMIEQREKSLKELLQSMDDYAPIIPDAVTDYYLSKSGFKTNDHRITRLLALATQKFISDIATDAYQFSRIRAQSGPGSANNLARGRLGTSSGRLVLTMEDLSNVLTEYGINARRPDFYR